MNRVIIQFKDECINTINIEGTDIFEKDEYLHIYNGTNLVGVVLVSLVKVAYKSKMREQ